MSARKRPSAGDSDYLSGLEAPARVTREPRRPRRADAFVDHAGRVALVRALSPTRRESQHGRRHEQGRARLRVTLRPATRTLGQGCAASQFCAIPGERPTIAREIMVVSLAVQPATPGTTVAPTLHLARPGPPPPRPLSTE